MGMTYAEISAVGTGQSEELYPVSFFLNHPLPAFHRKLKQEFGRM